MGIVLGTDDGLWRIANGPEQLGLLGKRVTHVAQRDGVTLAAVPRDGLYTLDAEGERLLWKGDARSCAIAADGAWFTGVEPAMIYRSDKEGVDWRRLDEIDGLPTRNEWTFPPPPHHPHVLSIDFLPGEAESVLAGIEVGGVILSRDRGDTWCELANGLYADVHSVRPDRCAPGWLVAVTGRGFYASEDGGESWERRMDSMGNGYTIGLAINPGVAGEVLVSAGDQPPGMNGRVYHSRDSGRGWAEVSGPPLPGSMRRAPVPFWEDGSAWLATDTGLLLRADDPSGAWALEHELPVRINAVAAGGGSSSVMH